jgi:hypothetical protein
MTTAKFDWVHAPAVLDTLNRYAWGMDSIDLDLLGSVFTDQATTAGVIACTDSGWGPWQGRETIVSQLGAIRREAADIRRHQISTPVFTELNERTAVVKAYLAVFSTKPPAAPKLVTTGQYVAHLSNVDGQWLIDNLDAVLDGAF